MNPKQMIKWDKDLTDAFEYSTQEGGVTGAVKGALWGVSGTTAMAVGAALAGGPIGWGAFALAAATSGGSLALWGAKKKEEY